MSKKPIGKPRYHDEAFKLEALRILSASRRKVEEVAADLGIARSTLSKWKTHYTQVELLAGPHDDVQKELARLRRENELLRAERDLLKKATAFVCAEHSCAVTPRRPIDELRADRCKEG